MDLICLTCEKERDPVRYTIAMKEGHEPLKCQYCKTREVIAAEQAERSPTKVEMKSCLRCSKTFESDGYYVCKPCKDTDSWKEGNENYTINLEGDSE